MQSAEKSNSLLPLSAFATPRPSRNFTPSGSVRCSVNQPLSQMSLMHCPPASIGHALLTRAPPDDAWDVPRNKEHVLAASLHRSLARFWQMRTIHNCTVAQLFCYETHAFLPCFRQGTRYTLLKRSGQPGRPVRFHDSARQKFRALRVSLLVCLCQVACTAAAVCDSPGPHLLGACSRG